MKKDQNNNSLPNKANFLINQKLRVNGLLNNSLGLLYKTLDHNKNKYRLIGWNKKSNLLNKITQNGKFIIKSDSNSIIKKVNLSDFVVGKLGISKISIDEAYGIVSRNLARYENADFLNNTKGKTKLSLLNINTKVIRKKDGKPVSIVTALSETGFGYVVSSVSDFNGFKYKFWIFN